MDISVFYDQYEFLDFAKAIGALIAGMILGFERELKDKAAGLRTITLICLGSTLFTLLSYKIGSGPSEDATRIASYVVSGIGFLGAGVIFKDAFSISGLTTASIIWLAAAVGMSIGFGHFSLALTFLICGLLIIHLGGFLNKKFLSNVSIKTLRIKIAKEEADYRNSLASELGVYCKRVELKKVEMKNDDLCLFYECSVINGSQNLLENNLIQNAKIKSFEI